MHSSSTQYCYELTLYRYTLNLSALLVGPSELCFPFHLDTSLRWLRAQAQCIMVKDTSNTVHYYQCGWNAIVRGRGRQLNT